MLGQHKLSEQQSPPLCECNIQPSTSPDLTLILLLVDWKTSGGTRRALLPAGSHSGPCVWPNRTCIQGQKGRNREIKWSIFHMVFDVEKNKAFTVDCKCKIKRQCQIFKTFISLMYSRALWGWNISTLLKQRPSQGPFLLAQTDTHNTFVLKGLYISVAVDLKI